MEGYIATVLLFYILAFFVKNVKTYFSVGQSIRGKSAKLTATLILSAIIYLLSFAMLLYPNFQELLIPIKFLAAHAIRITGVVFISIALIIGLLALYEMRASWRVGIKYEQKTKLVTSGIYALSRNPYFLSYNLLFAGIFFIFHSVILLILILIQMVTFHFMILEEEHYLARVQGDLYFKYKRKTSRYFPGF